MSERIYEFNNYKFKLSHSSSIEAIRLPIRDADYLDAFDKTCGVLLAWWEPEMVMLRGTMSMMVSNIVTAFVWKLKLNKENRIVCVRNDESLGRPFIYEAHDDMQAAYLSRRISRIIEE